MERCKPPTKPAGERIWSGRQVRDELLGLPRARRRRDVRRGNNHTQRKRVGMTSNVVSTGGGGGADITRIFAKPLQIETWNLQIST